MKTITIEEEVWEKLVRIKLSIREKNLSEVLKKLMKNYKKDGRKNY